MKRPNLKFLTQFLLGQNPSSCLNKALSIQSTDSHATLTFLMDIGISYPFPHTSQRNEYLGMSRDLVNVLEAEQLLNSFPRRASGIPNI